jgi:hypothetical protein
LDPGDYIRELDLDRSGYVNEDQRVPRLDVIDPTSGYLHLRLDKLVYPA